MVKGYKFGILYAKENQKSEDEFFQNTEVGEDFAEFLDFIGKKIPLEGWTGYDAGLDVVSNKTGTHSIHAKFEDFDIMFHVSTMLPFDLTESQQVSRKSHLGNDIVVVIFQEKGNHPLFDPRWIRSFFNHVYVLIRKDEEKSKEREKTVYRIAVSYKEGVEVCCPGIPSESIFEKDDQFRDWLYAKMINCERASYSAPGFKKST